MPKYSFTAKSQQGETHYGVREAKDEYDLARSLRREGYILISALIGKKGGMSFKWDLSLFSFFGGVSFKEKMFFARNLQVMIEAGISLPKALRTLSQQTESASLKKALLGMESEITKGKSFSDALLEHRRIFSEFFCNMVKVGEESGTLGDNLKILSRQMEREQELKSKIQSAMIYPAVVILAMLGIGAMMLIVVVPKLGETFNELEVELPLTTKLVIWLGDFLSEKWYFAIFILIILFIILRWALKTESGKKIMGLISLRIPVISPIIKKTNSAYIVRNLSALISAGVPLVRSLEIISNTLGNIYYKKAIFGAIGTVKKGEKLSEALKPHRDLFSLTVIQMIEVGEETGEMSDVLEKLGYFFEEEVAAATKNLITIIEPVLMLMIGAVVGFFAISMIQPMYTMLEGLE